MELEHLFQQSNAFTAFQLLFVTSFLLPEMAGREDIYRSLIRSVTSSVVTFTPVGMLLFILYRVGQLQ